MPKPELQRRAEEPYVSIPIEVTLREWGRANALVPEIFGWLEKNGLTLAGAPFYRYWIIGDEERKFSLEVGVPLHKPVSGDGRVIAGTKPAGLYAVMYHQGHPDRLKESFGLLDRWAEQEGIAWANRNEGGREVWGGRFESFLTNPEEEPDLNKWTIEVAYLVSESPAGSATDFPDRLSNPAKSALAHAGYTHLEQLAQVSAKEIGGLHGMGPKGVGMLREALAKQGLSFADE